MKTKLCFIVAIGSILLALLMMLPVGGNLSAKRGSNVKGLPMDLSAFSDARPEQSLDVLFIHHSTGGQWLADPGPEAGNHCIYETHPNGAGLRTRMQAQGYIVHEASYGGRIGKDTDLFDWLPKFRGQMPDVLICDCQDTFYTGNRRNRVVMFKSCFPNNAFVGTGMPPGDPEGPDLTVANAKATYTALLDEFQQHREVLFVCVTAPPLAPRLRPDPLWKTLTRWALDKPSPAQRRARSAELARQFNNWLKAHEGWLKDYPHTNVVVFDYYDILTNEGVSDLLAYPTGNGIDSHPSREGQQRATEALVPFLNRAVHRAGLSQ